MAPLRAPEIRVETIWRTILVTDARNSSTAYFSEKADEALVQIETDRALFGQIAAAYGGEEVRDRGDGSMFAFCDPAAGLRAAMAMQSEIAARNAARPDESLHLVHRMGLQMGEIKLATTHLAGTGPEAVRRKLTGDIVVTASRLEAICHPGEVCFSNDVYRAVRGEIEHEFRYLDSTLKGFDRPMRCWSTRIDREWTRPLTAEEEQTKQRRREERRLREKWEREQRERHRRYIGVRVAGACALTSVSVAAWLFLSTQTNVGERIDRAWEAFRGPASSLHPVAASVVAAPDEPRAARVVQARPVARPAAKRRTRVAALHPASRAQVAAVLRKALGQGRLDDVPAQLAEMRLPEAEYQTLCDDAQRVERAKDWLAVRLQPAIGDETKGITLDPPAEGLTVLTRAEDQAVVGIDGAERHRTIPYTSLAPQTFDRLLRAASSGGGETAPDSPAACARSLAALRRRIEQR